MAAGSLTARPPQPAQSGGAGTQGAVASGAYNVFSATCPARQVLDIVADKWTVLVIGALEPGTKRFQQLRRDVGGVTQKMLTQTLRDLERDGLVSRRAYATVPPRVEYTLTPLGRTLTELLAGVRVWSEAHVPEIAAARAVSAARAAARDDAIEADGV